MSGFIEKCLAGDFLEDEIDDFVESWHSGEAPDLELHEFLGMTPEEYSVWAASPSVLRYIVAARKRGNTLDQELADKRFAMAARAENGLEARKITEWLKRIGKI